MQNRLPKPATLLILGLVLTFASLARAVYLPIPLTQDSYNEDIIVESNAIPRLLVVTTASVDEGTNNVNDTWMEMGADPDFPSSGLPTAGSTFTAQSNPNYTFRMAPSYSAPNGILIDTAITNGTWTLITPAAYSKLSFCGSGGNGGDTIGVKVHHADSTTEFGSFGCPDWYYGTVGLAWIANGRMNAVSHTFDDINTGNPRLYFRDITLTNTTSPITSIELYYIDGSEGAHNDIVAVSGSTDGTTFNPIAVTGYTYDFVMEASAAIRGRVTTTNIVDGTNVWATTQTMDDFNEGYSWYERGYNYNCVNTGPVNYGVPAIDAIAQASGLPPAGTSITNAAGDHVYTFAPDYTTNNVAFISPNHTDQTLTLVTPAAYSGLSFLVAAGNGPVMPTVTVLHSNAPSEVLTITVPDWFSDITPAFVPDGRVEVESAEWSEVYEDISQSGNKLFSADIPLADPVNPVIGIQLSFTDTDGRAAIFAVSGTLGDVAPIISRQPESAKTYETAEVTFSVETAGTPPFGYQWQKRIGGVFVNLTDGGIISGTTTATLTLSSVTFEDSGDYRVVVTNVVGAITSEVANLAAFSLLPDVTSPGDAVSILTGSTPGAEGVVHAIDDNTSKFLNYDADGVPPFIGFSGFTVTPNAGRTVVSALRFYTANDAPERDPADFTLEGSNDGGSTYSLIASNVLSLPTGRNAGGAALNPLAQNVQEVHFANIAGYTKYRLTFPHVRDAADANSMSIGEVEFLGEVLPPGLPYFNVPPFPVTVYDGGSASFTAYATGDPAPDIHWQVGTNGVYVDLVDGGIVSGAQSPTVTLSPVSFNNEADFIAIATNSFGSVTSSVARLTVISTLTDVTTPSDVITAVGDDANGFYGLNGDPLVAINDIISEYQNGGSGLNASAGFPPFVGPAGVFVTPSAGATLVTAFRIYASDGGLQRDPVDYRLRGSLDGGASFTTISSGPLNLPLTRNNFGDPLNPTAQSLQEVRFGNGQAFTSYELTFSHTRSNMVSNVQIGQIELLGVTVPRLTLSVDAGGTLTLNSTMPGTLLSTTNLAAVPVVWENEGPISGSVTITPSPSVPQKYYRVSVP